MTQEEKELLLKDLCARLPYGIFVREDRDLEQDPVIYTYDYHPHIDKCKAYLRPMSSMTEDEKETYEMFFNEDGLLNTSIDTYLDWLLENHFDYRGLIHIGLALEAPNNMYKEVV